MVHGTLQELQPHFRDKLLIGVKQFNKEMDDYMNDYDEVRIGVTFILGYLSAASP